MGKTPHKLGKSFENPGNEVTSLKILAKYLKIQAKMAPNVV